MKLPELQEQAGWRKVRRQCPERSDSDVCHLTGPRFSFGYLRLEIDTDGTFWTKRVYKMDRLITIPLSLK